MIAPERLVMATVVASLMANNTKQFVPLFIKQSTKSKSFRI